VVFFTLGAADKANAMDDSKKTQADVSIFNDIQLKVAYSPEGDMKIFALAKNNVLKNYKSSNGNNLPESDSIVIGSDEAKMMISEKLFKRPGDELNDLFGINTKVEGILDSSGTFADDFHFLSSEQYNKLQGDSDVLIVKLKDENTPKLFYLYDAENPSSAKIELSEGNMNLFNDHFVGKNYSDKKIYYPIILGAKEANMMREEKLFTKTGDTIDGFFGKNVIIVGITKETNTGLDMIHIVQSDFFSEPVQSIKRYSS
jgi:hypothetical protein